MANLFQKATKEDSKLRVALDGVSGAGKSYTALMLATVFAQGQPIAAIDTERGSLSKYADLFEFDVLNLESHHPTRYIEAIKAAEEAGYAVLVIDSLTHAWTGKDGALELVDKAAKRSQAGNSFTAWRDVTPLHNALVDTIIGANLHVIATMRSKTEYVMVENAHGKKEPRKIGMAPVQRDGMEYEFDILGDLDLDHTLVISKSRCPDLADGVFPKPGPAVGLTMLKWATGRTPASKAAPEPEPKPAFAKAPAKAAPVETPAPVVEDAPAPPVLRSTEQVEKITSNWTALQVEAAEVGVAVPDVDLALPDAAIRDQYLAYKDTVQRARNAEPVAVA